MQLAHFDNGATQWRHKVPQRFESLLAKLWVRRLEREASKLTLVALLDEHERWEGRLQMATQY